MRSFLRAIDAYQPAQVRPSSAGDVTRSDGMHDAPFIVSDQAAHVAIGATTQHPQASLGVVDVAGIVAHQPSNRGAGAATHLVQVGRALLDASGIRADQSADTAIGGVCGVNGGDSGLAVDDGGCIAVDSDQAADAGFRGRRREHFVATARRVHDHAVVPADQSAHRGRAGRSDLARELRGRRRRRYFRPPGRRQYRCPILICDRCWSCL